MHQHAARVRKPCAPDTGPLIYLSHRSLRRVHTASQITVACSVRVLEHAAHSHERTAHATTSFAELRDSLGELLFETISITLCAPAGDPPARTHAPTPFARTCVAGSATTAFAAIIQSCTPLPSNTAAVVAAPLTHRAAGRARARAGARTSSRSTFLPGSNPMPIFAFCWHATWSGLTLVLPSTPIVNC